MLFPMSETFKKSQLSEFFDVSSGCTWGFGQTRPAELRKLTVCILLEYFHVLCYSFGIMCLHKYIMCLLVRCSWRGLDCNRTHLFSPVWTDVGLCYSFNGRDQQLQATETG